MAKPKVNKYVRGTNELLDRFLEDEEVWIVNGHNGRFPIIASSEEEAVAIYESRDKRNYSSLKSD